MCSYCVDILPLGDPVSYSPSMTADFGLGNYHYRYGNVLEIDFDLCHGYCFGNVSHPSYSHRVRMTLGGNCQLHCYYENNHASEHLHDWQVILTNGSSFGWMLSVCVIASSCSMSQPTLKRFFLCLCL